MTLNEAWFIIIFTVAVLTGSLSAAWLLLLHDLQGRPTRMDSLICWTLLTASIFCVLLLVFYAN